jgi:hypothetical protein
VDDARLFVCARCRCQVWVCSRCDRGQRYCAGGCATAARRASVRAAGARYQSTRRGRHCHAERQRRYRARRACSSEEVTHHGSALARGADTLAVPALSTREEPVMMSATDRAVPRCQFCGRPVSPFVRTGWVRSRSRRAGSFLPVP